MCAGEALILQTLQLFILGSFFFLGYAGLQVGFEDQENKCLHNTIPPGTAWTILGISFAKIYIKCLL